MGEERNWDGREILIAKKINVFCPSAVTGKALKLLDNISLTVRQNDVLGLVGETGSGKSILIDAIGRNPRPPLWSKTETLSMRFSDHMDNLLIKDEEELRKIWGQEIAFLPCNARERLNPLLTVGKQIINIFESKLEIPREEARQKAIEVFKKVQMPDPVENFDSYPHELSGGMAQRVLISIALSISPTLLLADEPTMGLDVTIQAQVLDLIVQFVEETMAAVILATRDLGIVANYCNRVAVLCEGKLVEFTDVKNFFKNAKHPYSHYLLSAAFASHGEADGITSELIISPKMIKHSEIGCPFVNRCSRVKALCTSVDPPETFITPTHYIKCHAWEG